MGLASKLAASQAGGSFPSAAAPPPGQYPPQLQSSQRPTGYPGQGRYQAYSGANPQGQQGQYPPRERPGQQYGASPQQIGQPYGAPHPPQGGQQYAAPPRQAGSQEVASYKQLLQAVIQEKGLQNFISPNDPRLDFYANKAPAQVDQLCQRWRVPKEVGQDIVKLALFDIILYIDNSGSMQFEENGERKNDLKLILSRVAYAASLFDDDGISVRFMNMTDKLRAAIPDMRQLDGIRSEQQAESLVERIPFAGLTPLGTQLEAQVLEPMVLARARSGQLAKPVLIITITDGQPAGEAGGGHHGLGKIGEVIENAINQMRQMPRYGQGALSFQFAQVGNDQAAKAFLSKLDTDPEIGKMVDCTSNYENEQEEMMRANPPVDLTPELWLVKLLLGAVDSSYDTQDEQTPANTGYGAPPFPGQFGAPPPQQGYSQVPPQGYGQAPSYTPQQGGYGRPLPSPGQTQGGYSQGGYPQGGYVPQSGGYPPQQGGYGGAPPPPPPRY